MKKYVIFSVCCLFAALLGVIAQQGGNAASQQGGFSAFQQDESTLPQQGVSASSQQVAHLAVAPQQATSTVAQQQVPQQQPPQQQGFTGPGVQGGFTGPGVVQGWGGFSGPAAVVTVGQSAMFGNKTPVIMRGNIVQQISHDRYVFRDATGDIAIKIKRDKWFGLTVGPDDVIEIFGDFKRDKKNWQWVHVDVKQLRKP